MALRMLMRWPRRAISRSSLRSFFPSSSRCEPSISFSTKLSTYCAKPTDLSQMATCAVVQVPGVGGSSAGRGPGSGESCEECACAILLGGGLVTAEPVRGNCVEGGCAPGVVLALWDWRENSGVFVVSGGGKQKRKQEWRMKSTTNQRVRAGDVGRAARRRDVGLARALRGDRRRRRSRGSRPALLAGYCSLGRPPRPGPDVGRASLHIAAALGRGHTALL